MAYMSAKFDEEAHNGLVSIAFTSLFHICQLWPWPLTSNFNRVRSLTMANMSAKFDEEAHNGLVSIAFTSLFYICQLWLWPLTSKINRICLLTMANISAKFDEEEHTGGSVSIAFTSLFLYMSIVTLTFDLWPKISIGFVLSLWLTCLPSLMKKHTMV